MSALESSRQQNHKPTWFLETISGPRAGQVSNLPPGQVVEFGRRADLDSAFPDDGRMSRLHFSAELDGAACKIKDLNSRNGTFVNGTRVQQAVLARNDLVTAGETTFALRYAVPRADLCDTAMASPQEQILFFLRNNFQPLFAILDAARDQRVLAVLLESQARYQSLYEGPKGETLNDVAPYLVQLPKDADLLRILIQEGWGKSWGIYLKCYAEFQEVRRYLRHFLEVRQPDGEQVYFRFYDPRVLRVYLPTLASTEAGAFLGPIHCYLMEDKEPHTLLQFLNAEQGVARVPLPLTVITQPGQGTAPTAPETYAVD